MWRQRYWLAERAEQDTQLRNGFGRLRRFYGGRDDGPEAADFMPQSTVADMLWTRFIPVGDMARSYGGALILTVHDQVLLEIPERHRDAAAKDLKALMEVPFDNVAPGFNCPAELKWSTKSWGEMQKMEV